MFICFITSCSKNKLPGGKPFEECGYERLPDKNTIRTRNEIRRRITKRELRGDLRNALMGHDFGGTESGYYLPAFKRYGAGSFMSSLLLALGADHEMLKMWLNENQLFFISGLYGLVEADEPIQNYDVHLEDTKKYWSTDLLTRHLMNLIEVVKCELVLNCSANYEYSRMIKWDILEKKWEVLHAAGENFENSQVRSAAGEIAANADGEIMKKLIHRGDYINKTDADIRFVPTKKFYQIQSQANQQIQIRRDKVGVIVINEQEFIEFDKTIGRTLNRFFEFIPISSKSCLNEAKSKGCCQCICRINQPKHKDYQVIFGKESLEEAIREAGMERIIIKDGYSRLRLKFKVD